MKISIYMQMQGNGKQVNRYDIYVYTVYKRNIFSKITKTNKYR